MYLHTPAVEAGSWWRVDTASGSDTGTTVYAYDGAGPIPNYYVLTGSTVRNTSWDGTARFWSATQTLYLKELTYQGVANGTVVTSTGVTLAAPVGGAPVDIATISTTVAALPTTYASLTKVPISGSGFRIITAVVYHGVSSLAGFQGDMDRFQEFNYTTVTLDQIADFFDGVGTLPAKPLLISFDDGNVTGFSTAYPELLSRGMKATFYIVPDWIDGLMTQADAGFADANPFTWANATTMQANGMDMQSHSQHHTNQTTLTQAQVTADFVATKARIEAMVAGSNVRHIAYPSGLANDTVKAGLKATGICRTGRLVRINEDGSWPAANAGGYDFIFPSTDPYAMPCAGAGGWGYVGQANYYHQIGRREELIPDYGFEAGGKGWTIGTGFSIDSSGGANAHAGSKSLKALTASSSQSSSNSRLIPIDRMALLEGSVWIKTDSVTGNAAQLRYDLYAADGTTTAQSQTTAVQVTGTTGWTQYTFTVGPVESAVFLRVYCWTVNVGAGGTVWYDDLSVKRMHSRGPGARPGY